MGAPRSTAEGFDHLWEALDEPGRDLAKVSRPLGEAEACSSDIQESAWTSCATNRDSRPYG